MPKERRKALHFSTLRLLTVIEGEVLSNNHKMLKLMARLGFASKTREKDSGIMKVSKPL